MGASVSATVVFRRRDPTLITNDNLESSMGNDDLVDSMTYALGKNMAESIDAALIKSIEGAYTHTPTATMKTTGFGHTGSIGPATSSAIGKTVMRSQGKPVEVRPFDVYLDAAFLEDASSPYNIAPETLANLWVVRFGKGWVGNEAVDDLEDDVDWWRHAANRLRELGYLEMHTLASSYRVVLRIVE